MKYSFNSYNPIFIDLFSEEKHRIIAVVNNNLVPFVCIEHVGSTAIPNLGGKGIIDILITVDKKHISQIYEHLEKLGYIFRETGSSEERLFFRSDLPDKIEGTRRYHVHLTFPECKEGKDMIYFRDYLINNKEVAQYYANLKHKACELTDEKGEIYRKLKEPFINNILSKSKTESL